MIRSYASGFIFTTSLPPAIMAGARAAIAYRMAQGEERRAQQLHTRAVKQALAARDIPVIPNPSHIVPILVGDAELVEGLAAAFEEAPFELGYEAGEAGV